MPDDLTSAILENAQGPKRVQGDEATVEQHPLPDQIQAAKHLDGNTGVEQKTAGLRFKRIGTPGPIG